MTSVNNSTAALFETIGGRAKQSTSVSAEMEDKFLTLLMTQMKNQDPLNPLDNTELTSQLAQMNTVNGIEKLNKGMSELLAGYNETQAMQAASMIGKNVLVAGNALPLSEGKAFGGVLLDGKAESVTVSIKDSTGRVVQTQQLGAHEAGNLYFTWDGLDAKGNPVADGTYKFTVDALSGGKAINATAMQLGTVSAVVRQNNSFVLDLGALGSVSFKDVQQIL